MSEALLALASWTRTAPALLLIGTAGARLVLARLPIAATDPIWRILSTRLRRVALGAALAFSVGAAFTLIVEVDAWFGAAGVGDPSRYRLMVTRTAWGGGWLTLAAAAIAILIAQAVAGVWSRLRPSAGVVSTVAACLSIPLVGHGGSHGDLVWMLHAAHVLGSGLWIGSLAALLVTTWPAWRDRSASLPLLRAVLIAFSPIALVGAAVAIASGTLLAVDHLPTLDALWRTDYGRTLIAKTAVVGVVVAIGWRNWKRWGPKSADAAARRRLRQSAVTEVAVASVVVLALTAWLSGLPMPG